MIFRVPCSLPCCPRDASRGLMPTPVLQGVNLASLGLLTTALHLQKETESLWLNSLNLSRGRASLGEGNTSQEERHVDGVCSLYFRCLGSPDSHNSPGR